VCLSQGLQSRGKKIMSDKKKFVFAAGAGPQEGSAVETVPTSPSVGNGRGPSPAPLQPTSVPWPGLGAGRGGPAQQGSSLCGERLSAARSGACSPVPGGHLPMAVFVGCTRAGSRELLVLGSSETSSNSPGTLLAKLSQSR